MCPEIEQKEVICIPFPMVRDKEVLLTLKENPVYAVSNCGLPNEKHYYSAEELDESSGYLTIVIVKPALTC